MRRSSPAAVNLITGGRILGFALPRSATPEVEVHQCAECRLANSEAHRAHVHYVRRLLAANGKRWGLQAADRDDIEQDVFRKCSRPGRRPNPSTSARISSSAVILLFLRWCSFFALTTIVGEENEQPCVEGRAGSQRSGLRTTSWRRSGRGLHRRASCSHDEEDERCSLRRPIRDSAARHQPARLLQSQEKSRSPSMTTVLPTTVPSRPWGFENGP